MQHSDGRRAIGVTGATGFVGRHIVARLGDGNRFDCVTASRNSQPPQQGVTANHQIGDIGSAVDWGPFCKDCDVIIHTAGLAHVQNAAADRIRAVNVDGLARLIEDASAAGVRRIVYVSSIKVLGEGTQPGEPFTNVSPLAPADPYAESKAEAERLLQERAKASNIETVIVRPPLVYGPGVGANFRRLLELVDRGIPLPLASIDNRRSLVAVQNLTDLLISAATKPEAAGQIFLAADGHDLSTPALFRRLAVHMGRASRLFPFPPRALQRLAQGAGRSDAYNKIAGTLQVDIGHTRQQLDWSPPLDVDAALANCARAFLAERRRG